MSATAESRTLAEQIEALTPPDRLRLAAQLLEAQRPELAKTIVERVSVELGAALLLTQKGGKG